MKLENYKIVDVVRAATVATGEHWTDGKGRSGWEKFKAFWLKVWNLIRHNALYKSEVELKSIMMDAKLGDLKTPVCVYAVGVTPPQTYMFTNNLGSNLFNTQIMKHDHHIDASDIDCYKLASFTSSIPFVFSCDTSPWGFKWLDGALASMAPYEHVIDDNHFIISVCDEPAPQKSKVQPRTFGETWKTKLPLFLGNIYCVFVGAKFLYKDKAWDQMVGLRLSRKEGQIKEVIDIDTVKLRAQVEDCPSWIAFNKHTDAIVDELFKVSYDWAVHHFNDEKKYPPETWYQLALPQEKGGGLSMGITGGACLGYNQAPVIAAIWQKILDTQIENEMDISPPFNSFSGNSVGAIQSMFFAWMQDLYYDPTGEGQKKLLKMIKGSSFRIQDFQAPALD